jgi:iron complex transport system permease protein
MRVGIPMTPYALESILIRALPHLAGMLVSALVIACVSLAFQTSTGSRILTPSMVGFDSVFIGTQTFLVFFLGASAKIFANSYTNFFVTAGVMVAISMLMYGAILRNSKNNVIFLLLFGLILSGIIRSASSYLQKIMDVNDYYQLQAATAVTINNMNIKLIYAVAPIMLVLCSIMLIRHRTYDVLALGEANAKNLGVHFQKEINFNLILISIGMSLCTALIGSLTFLGLLAVNIARELFKTHRHSILFIASSLAAALALVFGQGITELLQGAVPITVIIDVVGCSYMFYLILKENKKI